MGAEDVLKIEDGSLDVERIMARIDERIEERRLSGIYDESQIAHIMQEVQPEGADQCITNPLHELNFVTRLATLRGQVSSEYQIGSAKKFIGPIIVLVKRIIRKMMRTYVDAVFSQQNEFNAYMVRSLQLLEEMIRSERERSGTAPYDRMLSYDLQGEDEDQTVSMLAPVAGLFNEEEAVINLFSARGDFLRAARNAGIEARGVEGDEGMVRLCQERGLHVELEDPFSWLNRASEASLPAVFSSDLGERMSAGELMWITGVLGYAVKRGGLLAVCNHNPTDAEGRAALLRDLAVVRPVYPETLRHLLEAAGFGQVRVISLGSRYLLTARRS